MPDGTLHYTLVGTVVLTGGFKFQTFAFLVLVGSTSGEEHSLHTILYYPAWFV